MSSCIWISNTEVLATHSKYPCTSNWTFDFLLVVLVIAINFSGSYANPGFSRDFLYVEFISSCDIENFDRC